ncbi:MAG: metalloregulator ArsR/SmtB family transcription factor [Sedimentisphaerales bacterium]|jgi:DNA-binding transcriptional ArsR family regulator
MADAEKLAGIFKLFSVETRVRIVQALKRRSLCVTELTSQLGISQEATSQHLRVMRDAGIVWFQKRGFHVYYSLDKQNMAFIHKTVSALFEPGNA